MERIALFGGTFNPIHNGHLHLARAFANRIRADTMLLIPSRVPPHKAAPDLADARHRLAMCALAAQDSGLFDVSDLELNREGPSYTVDTLLALKEQHPQASLYLLMGEDMFLTLERWHKPHLLYSLCTLCAVPRSSGGLSQMAEYASWIEQFGAKYQLENLEYLPVSSTMVRLAVQNGQSIAGMVPTAVEKYILNHNLYLE